MTTATLQTATALPEQADWHETGLWVAFDAAGVALPDTFASTAYSARAELVRNHNLLWSKAVAAGYTIKELAPVAVMAVEERLRKPD